MDRTAGRITAATAVTCLGRGRAAHLAAMREGRSGLARCDWEGIPFDCHVGRVAGIEADPFPETFAERDNRATRLLEAALASDGMAARVEAMRERWGPGRCAVVLGTSTSGVERLETVWRARPKGERLPAGYSLRHHNDHQAVTAYLAARTGLAGPAFTVSTACSSSAKALVDAGQLIATGLADAVLCGAVDSLCLTSLAGFEALELVSRAPCRPCDAHRDGLSIGEGAALTILERGGEGARIAGYGESSDATSMSTPPEDGAGAAAAMRAALAMAGAAASELAFVKLHGTATPTNDVTECRAVSAVTANRVPAFSLKGAIGHSLGAAGGVETAMALWALEDGLLPGTVGLSEPDPAIAVPVTALPARASGRMALANAFGFGGNNCALVLAV